MVNYYKAQLCEHKQSRIQYVLLDREKMQKHIGMENNATQTELSCGSLLPIHICANLLIHWLAAYLFFCQHDWQFLLPSRSNFFCFFQFIGISLLISFHTPSPSMLAPVTTATPVLCSFATLTPFCLPRLHSAMYSPQLKICWISKQRPQHLITKCKEKKGPNVQMTVFYPRRTQQQVGMVT